MLYLSLESPSHIPKYLNMGHQSAFKLCISMLLLFVSVATSSSTSDDRKAYIVHMDKLAKPDTFSTLHEWYMSTLASLSSPDDSAAPVHLYTYKHVMDGFSAVLSRSHLGQLESHPSHIATFSESIGHALTTHTPKFLGLSKQRGLWPAGKFGNDVIIGVLDTGIWPESESFHDRGMPPVPSRWGGTCETGTDFNSSHCNKKLIGARRFSQGMKHYGLSINTTYDYDSPRDWLGHGSHTSSIAAGSRVLKANSFGYAEGTASGMAPLARIAMYKVIFYDDDSTTYDAAITDTLAGMDQAIEDGVDIMSLSLGFDESLTFFENPIALGAFAAISKGILVICAAGNGGPHGYTMLNGAPWLTTVAAGTVDREYIARLTLGDGFLTLTGKSVYPQSLFVSRVPLYFGLGNSSKEACDYNSLDPNEVAGKFVFCDSYERSALQTLNQAENPRRPGIAGAIGAIITDDDAEFYRPDEFYLPFVVLKTKDAQLVKNYILNDSSATVSVEFQVTVLGTKPAPKVAYFSSRGPDERSPWILKPDILAPGYQIMAAWVPNRGFQEIGDQYDYLTTDFALESGTSMATPHVAGLAALLKTAHPDWSPATIRSAIMTTADVTDNSNGRIIDMTTGVAGTPLDFGAGHINPNKALDPGLVYDLQTEDYIRYICALNYTRKQIQIITRTSNFSCDDATLDLNYPSFMVILNNTNTTTSTFKRVLMNTEDNNTTYTSVLQVPSGMKATVQPQVISFQGKWSQAEFNLTIDVNLEETEDVPQSDYFGNYGFLTWYEIEGIHVVRSVIVSAIASSRNP